MTNMLQKYIFHVDGMHCQACTLLTESKIGSLPYVTTAKSDLGNHSIEIEGNFGDKNQEQIAGELTALLEPHGYSVSIEKQTKLKKWSDFKVALPVTLGFMVLFILLQKAGLVKLVTVNEVTLGTAFVVGIIASLSSCMAVVGGLLLSMSVTFAKEGDRVRPQLIFHVGRLVSFFILGGVIGVLGSAFTLSSPMTFILSLVIALVMLILGINLLDVFDWAKKLQLSMPKFIAQKAHGVSKLNHTLTPLLVGIATFFLPCGFTQSMQLYTLTTGSFVVGGMTMFAFALGTLPVLALVSFSSFGVKNNPKSGIFFKSAGLVVIMFAIINLITSLVVIGLIPPIFNF